MQRAQFDSIPDQTANMTAKRLETESIHHAQNLRVRASRSFSPSDCFPYPASPSNFQVPKPMAGISTPLESLPRGQSEWRTKYILKIKQLSSSKHTIWLQRSSLVATWDFRHLKEKVPGLLPSAGTGSRAACGVKRSKAGPCCCSQGLGLVTRWRKAGKPFHSGRSWTSKNLF